MPRGRGVDAPLRAPPTMPDPARKTPWLVRTHHRMRTLAFTLMYIAACIHTLQQGGYTLAPMLLLGAVMLGYPQLLYWHTRRAAAPLEAEINNLRTDSFLLGIYMACLGFPLWLSFSATMGNLNNHVANRGWRGVGVGALGLLAGALSWMLVMGARFAPSTGWPAALFCMLGLGSYLLVMGHISHTRNGHLRHTREALKKRGVELLAANAALLNNLREIDGLQAQLREHAHRDPLTGLYNRRYLDATLEREMARCKREGQALSVILVDIDHFKQVNDTYGHQAGDAVLLHLSGMLAGMARAGDVACRYGGEEFLLLMPTMPLEIALERAEALRHGFGTLDVHFGDFRLQATVSIGIAVYPGHGTTADELIRAADRALYRAKHGGRNRVETDLPRPPTGAA
jgi:diguanylate cyclase